MKTLLKRFIVVFCILFSSCSTSNNNIIASKGIYSIGDNSSVEVYKDNNNKFNIKHYRSDGTIAHFENGIITDHEQWYIFVENSKEFFLVNGDLVTHFYEGTTNSGSKVIGSINESTLREKIPKKLYKYIQNKTSSS